MRSPELPVSELKHLIATGKELSKVMTFFFDRFGSNPGFLTASHPITVPDTLSQAVGQVIGAVWPRGAVTVTEWQIGEATLAGIVHGT